MTIPYRIATPRLLLRCWEPSDAAMLLEAISDSLRALQQWMPWAMQEPESLEDKTKQLQDFRREFEQGRENIYGIFDPQENRVLGSIGAHARIGAGAREIGYWIRTDQTGQGLATEAAGAMTRAWTQISKMHRIEIHCHPMNLASAAVPRKLGFAHAVTIRNRVLNPSVGPRDTAVWVMTSAAYAGSVVARQRLQAFDKTGTEIPLA